MYKSLVKHIVLTVFVLCSLGADAQINKVTTHAGRKGIWVLCGNQLPKDFSYRVLRQKNKEGWVLQAELTAPGSKEEINGKMLDVQRQSGLDANSLSEIRLNGIWDRLNDPLTNTIPLEMQNDYPARYASGTAWFDAAADSTVTYVYKVELFNEKNKVISESVSDQTAFPGRKPVPELLPLIITSVNGTFIGEFLIVNKERMVSCKIFRSYYLRSGYEEIQGEPIFTTRDSLAVVQFTDKSVVEKVPYTYVVQPLDAAGNYGAFSPELKAFNVADKTIIPSVTNFKTVSREKENAIQLSWSPIDSKDVISVDIFKNDRYDGDYVKIASVSPKDTTYLDFYAKPIETYHYTIRLNGYYEKSPMSPRVSGMLKASNLNYFPPQNLRLDQNKNIVKLSWERAEDDTRAYYVYRSIPKTTKLELIAPLIITDSAIVFYTDTLPAGEANMYAYAVADQNTSYVIGPVTASVFAYSQAVNALPIPHDLSVSQRGSVLQIMWPNLLKESSFITGYKLYRRSATLDGKQAEALTSVTDLLTPQTNIFTDSTAKEDMVYYYSLRTVGEDGKTLSSPSMEAGTTIYKIETNGISNVRVFAGESVVTLKWDNPIGESIKAIKIFRTTEGKAGKEEVSNLPADVQSFVDAKISAGNTYYYQMQVEYISGKKSKLTDEVGIKIYP